MSDPTPSGEASRAKRGTVWRLTKALLKVILVLFVLMVLLSAMGLEFLEIPIRLLFGWCLFIRRSFPNVQVVPEMIVSGLAGLTAAGIGLHLFLRWFQAWPDAGGSPWRWRSTFSLVAVLLLLFAVSIGGAGVVHQLGWLKGEPFMENRGMSASTSEAIKARRLMAMLSEWAASHHETYPPSLHVLSAEDSNGGRRGDVRLAQAGAGGTPEPWLYFGAGLKARQVEHLPVITSPRANDQGKRVVGIGDNSVLRVSEEEYQRLLLDLAVHLRSH